jgi:ribose 5-phosphate isomerase B
MVKSIALASDHGGYDLKEFLRAYLLHRKVRCIDLGTDNQVSVDYPDFAHSLAVSLKKRDADFGILICGTGIGVSIAANRFKHIRAALVHDTETAKLSRQHNDANVIVFGGRLINFYTARDSLDVFLGTDFDGGRHQKRIDKIL